MIVNWNGRPLLDSCLRALRGQAFPQEDTEILLVDNGSTDGSVAYVQAHYPEVKAIALPENRGFAGGANAGIQAARGPTIALLNNDAWPEPHWLEALVQALEAHPEVGFCASKILCADDPQVIDTAGDSFYTYGMGAKRGMGQRDGPQFSQEAHVFGACAGAALYRRALLEDLGGLDEDFFLYGEDVDLSFRAQLKGYHCLFVPEARAYHRVAATAGRGSDRVVYYNRRNMVYVLMKDLPTSLWLRHLASILFYWAGGDGFFVLSGHTGAILRARRDNLAMARRMMAKRKAIQATRRVSDATIESLLTHRPLRECVRSALAQLFHSPSVFS